MNYTENLHLPQWVKSDKVRMEDFNNAMSNIEEGYSALSQGPAVKPYVTGSYTADGDTQIIELGFRPSFIIISGIRPSSEADYPNELRYFAICGGSADLSIGGTAGIRRVQLISSGFATYLPTKDGLSCPNLCEKDRTYDYIAFR